jgi:hypothetical protein
MRAGGIVMRLLRILGLSMLAVSPALAESPYDGIWQGDYVCAQGKTLLRLTIRPEKDGTSIAYFHFFPPPDKPEDGRGCFSMRLGAARERAALALRQERWLDNPNGYVMVDLVGQVDLAADTFRGVVEGPFCSTFSLTRVTRQSDSLDPCAPVTQ